VEPVGIIWIHYDGSVRIELIHDLLLLIHADQHSIQVIRVFTDLHNLEARICLVEPQVIF
jgi:hypothetical protein